MPKRQRDVILRNRRQTKQIRLDKPPKPKMPKKGTVIRVKYNDSDFKDAVRAKENLERFGMKCELIKE